MTSQALLDLEWVLASPSLMVDPLALGPVSFSPESVDCDHLESFVAERYEHRVGRYFETLLHYWLVHVRNVDLLEAGLQLVDENQRTVGELDFVFRDEEGVTCHCEASVKFFLHYPNPDGSHFPGPAARDNFERKATKLFDSQLRLGRQHLPDIDKLHGLVRGMVFYQVGADPPATLPHRMADDHGRGYWVRASAVEPLEELGQQFQVVSKPTWFASVVDATPVPFGRFVDELGDHFDGPAFPVMVSIRNEDGAETGRCFVVPDAWPVATRG